MVNEAYLQYGSNIAHSKGELDDMEKETKFDIDEKFAAKINSIEVDKKDPWAKAIKKACFANDKWYLKFWKWIKGLFGCKPKKVRTIPVEPELNAEFDFQEWLIDRRDKIIKAIKEDGKDRNTITCPICYKDREYYIASGNKHIHSKCEYCGITITQ